MFDCDTNIFGVSHLEYFPRTSIPGRETRFVVKSHKSQPEVGNGLCECILSDFMHGISDSGPLWSFGTTYNSKYYEKMTIHELLDVIYYLEL